MQIDRLYELEGQSQRQIGNMPHRDVRRRDLWLRWLWRRKI
jgi:hypothetical protein